MITRVPPITSVGDHPSAAATTAADAAVTIHSGGSATITATGTHLATARHGLTAVSVPTTRQFIRSFPGV